MPLIGFSAGQTTISTNASMVGSMMMAEVLLQLDSNAASMVLLGTSTTQVFRLSAGAAINLVLSNLNQVYAKTSGGSAVINWLTHAADWRT